MSAPNYKALFEEGERRREETFTVPTEELTTQGDGITDIKGKTHPHFIRPWADFLKIQDSTWKRLRNAYPPSGPRAFDPLAYFKSCGNSISKRLLTSELDVAFLHRLSVENPVSDILSYLHTLPDVREEFSLKSTSVGFDNSPNALSAADEAIQNRANMTRTHSTPILCTPPAPPGPTKADQICVYATEVNGRPTDGVAFSVEHQSPHNITLDLLRVALRPNRDPIAVGPLISRSEDELCSYQHKAERTVGY
ncbi:MAG: hypothetical protein M1839_001451 [Geoglossum umbratile]|nr:MAG: hypothetical protein M1839_001451 [Geoglossum umbratile]